MSTDKKSAKITRRAALTRLGLAAGAAYAAPTMVGFNAARASGASGSSGASSNSGPSSGSGPSRSSRPSYAGRGNSGPSRPHSGRRMTPAEADMMRFFRNIFGA